MGLTLQYSHTIPTSYAILPTTIEFLIIRTPIDTGATNRDWKWQYFYGESSFVMLTHTALAVDDCESSGYVGFFFPQTSSSYWQTVIAMEG